MPDAWLPVVYGRTRKVDRWWRVRPDGLPNGWLEPVVQAVVAGGSDLAERPRFLLAAEHGVRLVGVACRAAELSDSMHSDGARELFCFVGWLNRASLPTPPLEELQSRYVAWAAPVYDRWVGPDWDRRPEELRTPHAAEPVSAPWDGAVPPWGAAQPATYREAWPSRDADALWEWGRATRQAHAIAIGFRSLPNVPEALSYITVDDVSQPTRLAQPDMRNTETPHVVADRSPVQEPRGSERDVLSRTVGAMGGAVRDKFFGGRDADQAYSDDRDSPRRRPIADPRDRERRRPPPVRLDTRPVDSREQWNEAWGFAGDAPEPVTDDVPARDPVAGAVEDAVAAPGPAETAAPVAEPPGELTHGWLPLHKPVVRQGMSFRAVDLSPDHTISVHDAPKGAVCFALRGHATVRIGESQVQLSGDAMVDFNGHEAVTIIAGKSGVRVLIVRRG